jgi:hypothetical protein
MALDLLQYPFVFPVGRYAALDSSHDLFRFLLYERDFVRFTRTGEAS